MSICADTLLLIYTFVKNINNPGFCFLLPFASMILAFIDFGLSPFENEILARLPKTTFSEHFLNSLRWLRSYETDARHNQFVLAPCLPSLDYFKSNCRRTEVYKVCATRDKSPAGSVCASTEEVKQNTLSEPKLDLRYSPPPYIHFWQVCQQSQQKFHYSNIYISLRPTVERPKSAEIMVIR